VIVQGVVTGVQFPACEPTVKWLVGIIKDLVPFFVPVAVFGSFGPEGFRVSDGFFKSFIILVGHICDLLFIKLSLKVQSEKLKVIPQHAEIIPMGTGDPENAVSHFPLLPD